MNVREENFYQPVLNGAHFFSSFPQLAQHVLQEPSCPLLCSAWVCCWQKRLFWSWWKHASSPAGALTCIWLQQSNIKVRLCGAQGWAQLSWWQDGSTSRDQELARVSTAALIAGSWRGWHRGAACTSRVEVYFGLKNALLDQFVPCMIRRYLRGCFYCGNI